MNQLSEKDYEAMLSGEMGVPALDAAREIKTLRQQTVELQGEVIRWQQEAHGREDRLMVVVDENTALRTENTSIKANLLALSASLAEAAK